LSTDTQRTSRTTPRRQTPRAPRSASARAYLRNGVPAVYREAWDVADVDALYPSKRNLAKRVDAFDDEDAKYAQEAELAELNLTFAMRFLKALEEVLDPIVTLLDCLPAHLDPKLAPLNALHTMADWLGLPIEEHVAGENRPTEDDRQKKLREDERHKRLKERQQRLVEHGLEINRTRGTKGGLELLLELMFGKPDRREGERGVFTVIDGGYCALDSAVPTGERPEPGTFVVQWTEHFDADEVRAIEHLVEREKPVNSRWTHPEPALSPEQELHEVNA
jgi:phage tail-like protein